MGARSIHLAIAVLVFSLLIGCETTNTNGPLQTVGTLWIHHPKGAVNYLNKQVDRLAPAIPGPADKALFLKYHKDGTAHWSPNWASRLDFTGIAWDSPRAGVLIHPSYVLFASHFQRRVGETLVFHDRHGHPHRRRLSKKKTIHRIGSPDVTVGQLDRPVPNSITHYSILPPGYDYRLLNGAKFLITDKERRVHIFRVNRVHQSGFEQIGGRKGFEANMHPNWHKRLVAGDSGHPAFLIINEQLVLLSTLRGGGWASQGPFYGGPNLQKSIIEAIASMQSSPTVMPKR